MREKRERKLIKKQARAEAGASVPPDSSDDVD